MKILKHFIVFIIIFIPSSCVFSKGWEPLENENKSKEVFQPYYMLSFGVSQRIDENESLSHMPSFHLRLYRFFKETWATKIGVSYNHSTRSKYRLYGRDGPLEEWQYGTEVRETMMEIGLRMQEPPGFFALYFETGLELRYYNEVNGNKRETRTGFNIVFGWVLQITKHSSIDFSLRQTVNYYESKGFLEESGIMPPDPPIYYYSRVPNNRFSELFYNPTTYQVLINIKL